MVRQFFKRAAFMSAALVLLLTLTGCGEAKFMEEKDMVAVTQNPTGTMVFEFTTNVNNQLHEYTVELGFELYYDKAPITVTNFVYLASSGFWDKPETEGEIGEFIVDTVTTSYIAMGDKRYEKRDTDNDEETPDEFTEVTVEPEYFIKGEFKENGFAKTVDGKTVARNDIPFELGTMYMLRSDSANSDSAYSRFGIIGTILSTDTSYKDKYAAFGKITSVKVTEGVVPVPSPGLNEDVFDKMRNAVVSSQREDSITIISVTVNTYGAELTKNFKKNWTIKVK